jgi:cobalt-zinc-cadmium efflux system outer membrane protein
MTARYFTMLLLAGVVHNAQAETTAPSAADGLTLPEAIAAALASNPQLKPFELRAQALQARVAGAALKPAPEIGLELENFAGSGEASGVDAAEATLALSQAIELGGKRTARIDAAEAESGVLAIERRAAQLDILAEVTRRFVAVAERQALLALARNATELAEKTVATSQRRVNAAKSPHVELDRARIALARAKVDEQQAAFRLEAALQSLAATWGESRPVLKGDTISSVKADLYQLPKVEEFPAMMQRLAANPDFLRFASEARLRDAEIRLAESQRKPDLTLSGGVRRLQESEDTALVASLSVPLFSRRRAEFARAEAAANRARVDAERQVTLVKAQAQLFELHQELRHAVLAAQTLSTETRPQMAEALEETRYAFERGRYSYLELVDAQREYLDVQRSVIEAAAEAHRLRVEIERLTNAPLAAPAGSAS